MTRPLRSARITRPQRYYETVRPRAPRRYSAPYGDGRLGISLSPLARQAGDSIGATGSHVPCKSPGQARAAYMPDAIWAVSRLPPGLSRSPGPAPVSTPLRKLTTRQQRFAFARLPDPHLTRSSPRLFRSAHHERHLNRRSLRWFEASACRATSEDLPPSPAQHRIRWLLHRTLLQRSWHTTWDFAYKLNTRPSPCTGSGPRIGRRKTRLTCGAPLRNRTVDLLLTIHNVPGSLPGRRFPQAHGSALCWSGSCRRLWHLRSLRPLRQPQSSSLRGSTPSKQRHPGAWLPLRTGRWGRIPAATSRPAVTRRSDDLYIVHARAWRPD